MPTLTGNDVSLNMLDALDFNTLGGSSASGSSTSTHFHLVNGATSYDISGVGFGNFQGGIPTTGTITDVTVKSSNHVTFTMTGLSMPMLDLLVHVGNNDPT